MSKLITCTFRGSFVQVLEPKAFSAEQDPKFSMVIPIPKDDEFIKKLKKAMDDVAMTKWGEIPKKLKTFLKDGDDEDEKYGWKNHIVFTATNKSAPGVLVKSDQGLVEPVSKDEIYSGAYYKASIRPYAYEYQNSKGIAISLDNVLKVKDGDKFSSKSKAEDDFADYANDDDWD